MPNFLFFHSNTVHTSVYTVHRDFDEFWRMIDGSRFWHFLSWLRFYSPPSRQASHCSVQLWALMQPAFPPSLASWGLPALPLASSALLLPTSFSPTSLSMRSRSGGENAESADQTFYVYTFPHVLLTSFSDASSMRRFRILLCIFFRKGSALSSLGIFFTASVLVVITV